MSQEVEFYVGMRIIALGREGIITKCNSQGYDIRFSNGEQVVNVSASSVTPFETVAVAKQVGGPPPSYPPHPSSVGAPAGGVQMSTTPQYQYPTAQAGGQHQPQQYAQTGGNQYQHQQQQQQHAGQSYYVGAASVPVVHSYSAAPITVSATPMFVPTNTGNINTQANSGKLDGFEFSPNLGQPFSELFDCGGPFWMSCCCPCIVGGQVAERLHYSSYGMIVIGYIATCVVLFILSIVTNTSTFWLLLWAMWMCVVLGLRSRVRRMWQIPGDGLDDCCITCFCLACSLAQVSRHVFGYRSADMPPCSSDGTPTWQRIHGVNTGTPSGAVAVVHQQPQYQQYPQQQYAHPPQQHHSSQA